MTKRKIYTRLKYLVGTLLLLPMLAQSQVDNNVYEEDMKYLESSFTRNYDSLLTSYFDKKNSHHILTKHYKHGDESFDDLMFDDIPDSVLFKRLNSIPAVIPMTYNGVVRSYIKMYVRRMTNNLNSMLSLAEYYFPFFEQALERHDMPLELKYLPIIESALNPQAVSRVGATGLWQFMQGTAKIYGLNINSLIDERKDPLKASDAAARYLRDLYEIFDNWHLAIAAYNCGPKNINKAIARSGGKRDFWDIYPYLPRETRGYIPAYIAATYVMTNYEKHNLRPTDVDVPIETDTIMIDRNLFFAQITKFIAVDDAQIRLLNPQYKEPIIPGASQSCYLRLPMEYVPQFIRLQDSIYEYGMDSLVKQIVQDIKPTETIVHIVRRNETMVKIAKRYGVTVAQIRSWNPRIRKNGMLKIGQRITIHRRNPLYNQIQYQAPQLLEKKQVKDEVVADTLTDTVSSVNVEVEKVQPKVKKAEKPKKQTVYHKVRKGETLSAIARKYGTTVKKIKQLNGLKSDKLKIGKNLKVK